MHNTPRPVYELEDMLSQQMEGQFQAEELSPVHITKRTMYKIDKLLKKMFRRGILGYLVCWRGYTADFDSWITASSVKNI